MIGRVIGWLFVAGAVAAFGVDAWHVFETGDYRPLAAGAFWAGIDLPSLNLVQAVIERYIWPPLWDPALLTVLRLPLWLVLGAIGLILVVLFRRRAG